MFYLCTAQRKFSWLRLVFAISGCTIAAFTLSPVARAQAPIQFDQVACSGAAPAGSPTTDLLVNGPCQVQGGNGTVAEYVFHNVNIVANGNLSFDDARIDFHAE